MNLRVALIVPTVAALLVPGIASAQKVERLTYFDAGDKSTYNWVLNGKAQQVEELWTVATDTEMVGVTRFGDKEIPMVAKKTPFAYQKRMCIGAGQACTFSPELKALDLPLEKGRRWSADYTLEGETFTAKIAEEDKVEAIEKVSVPAGEFDAFVISYVARIRGTNNKGVAFNLKGTGTHWVALIKGKPVWVKTVYSTSGGDKTNRELVSVNFK